MSCFSCVTCLLQRREVRSITLMLIGLDNAGKTTITNALQGDLHSSTTPTVGFSTATLNEADLKLNIYDLGGGRGIRRIWQMYISEVHGVIFVVDAADQSRFEESRNALHSIMQASQLAGKPLLVFANKQDCPGAATCSEISKALGLLQLPHGERQQHRTYACIAKATAGQQQPDAVLKQGLHWLIQAITPLYGQLQLKIDQEAAEARQQEEQRMRDRQQRAAANKAQRQLEEQEAAAAAAARQEQLATAAAATQSCKAEQVAQNPQANVERQTAAAGSGCEHTIQHSDAACHCPEGPQTAAPAAVALAYGAASPQVNQQELQDTDCNLHVLTCSNDKAATATAHVLPAAAKFTEGQQLGGGSNKCCADVCTVDPPALRGFQQVCSSSLDVPQGRLQPALAERGKASIALNLLGLLVPGGQAAMTQQFSDLKKEARDLLGPTPRTHSLISELSSMTLLHPASSKHQPATVLFERRSSSGQPMSCNAGCQPAASLTPHHSARAADAVNTAGASGTLIRVVRDRNTNPNSCGLLVRSSSLPVTADSVGSAVTAAVMVRQEGSGVLDTAAGSGGKTSSRPSFKLRRSFNNRVQPFP